MTEKHQHFGVLVSNRDGVAEMKEDKGEFDPIKNCNTCAHRLGSGKFASCIHCGTFCELARLYPNEINCGIDYYGWIPRPGLIQRIFKWLWNKTK